MRVRAKKEKGKGPGVEPILRKCGHAMPDASDDQHLLEQVHLLLLRRL